MTLRPDDPAWLDRCTALGVNPDLRLAARNAVLNAPDALDCCLYRPDEDDLDAEEQDLGDAALVIDGPFVPPPEWDHATREAYFEDEDPADFLSARIEPTAAPGSAQHFQPQPGDCVAVTQADGLVQMHYLHECLEQDDGTHCVLIREDLEL